MTRYDTLKLIHDSETKRHEYLRGNQLDPSHVYVLRAAKLVEPAGTYGVNGKTYRCTELANRLFDKGQGLVDLTLGKIVRVRFAGSEDWHDLQEFVEKDTKPKVKAKAKVKKENLGLGVGLRTRHVYEVELPALMYAGAKTISGNRVEVVDAVVQHFITDFVERRGYHRTQPIDVVSFIVTERLELVDVLYSVAQELERIGLEIDPDPEEM